MIPVEKNKIYEMQIDALGSNGEGIGRIDGYTVFVEGALKAAEFIVNQPNGLYNMDDLVNC